MFVSLTAAFSGTVWEKLLEWYRGSVFRELIDYFDETYFSVDLGEYRHFSVTTQTGSVVKNLILGIALGLIVAAVISCYVKTVHGGFVRRLLRELPPQDARLIIMRYYMDKTQTQVAKELGVSQLQVSRMEKKILGTMRKKF